MSESGADIKIPLFGARKAAEELAIRFRTLEAEHGALRKKVEKLGMLDAIELEHRKKELQKDILELAAKARQFRSVAAADEANLKLKLAEVRKSIVETEELALLQEAGIYHYRHPLTDAVQYEGRLAQIEFRIKEMAKKDGGAVMCAVSWTVNGSEAQGRAMVRDTSKLMLRAFNAEADNLVRGLKPYKLQGAIDKLVKVSQTIERLGKLMQIRISPEYLALRIQELELTADFLQKQAEEKEAERVERERLREERKAQQEIERERAKLEKEKAHYENAMKVLAQKGDVEALERMRAEAAEVDRAIADVDYRAANIRAGYVYVISNIGSFGEQVVKIGMTRRIDPLDRIRELSDASVPFNFDVHALFFSKDAVGIESKLHEQFASSRINAVNLRREFFNVTPAQVKEHLSRLTGELLQFQDLAEALEYRQCLALRQARA